VTDSSEQRRGPRVVQRRGATLAKRFFDLAVLALTSWIWAPLLVLVALSVRLVMGPGIIFVQRRCGLGGRPFDLYKFRTMTNAKDEHGNLLPDQLRVPAFARRLRASSLDELPSLLNVLKGEMSLVGPRPLLPEYLPLYTAEQCRRHEVKPGVTGWAQINGRNRLTWERKFEHDVWYVDHWTIGLDIRILCVTLIKVLYAEGISQDGHPTAERFRGDVR
jgi:sugar transferase EpsL